jgi:hypothetical protein
VILTTNRPFKEWNEVFPNATCIVTLLDRLLHHAEVTVIEGDSYRVRESEREAAARRRVLAAAGEGATSAGQREPRRECWVAVSGDLGA